MSAIRVVDVHQQLARVVEESTHASWCQAECASHRWCSGERRVSLQTILRHSCSERMLSVIRLLLPSSHNVNVASVGFGQHVCAPIARNPDALAVMEASA